MPTKKGTYIYKFAPINEFTFRNLILSQLWFGPPNSMNDQLEGLIKVQNTNFKPSQKAIDNFITTNSLENYYWDPRWQIKEQGFLNFYMSFWFRYELNRYGISCFSLNPKEPLMWAHYANKHNGLCLVYDKEELLNSLKDFDSSFDSAKVNYRSRPTLTLYERNSHIEFTSNTPVIASKNPNWKYEKEFRIFFKPQQDKLFQGQAILIDHSALKEVIYGYQVSQEDENVVSQILRNDPHYNVDESIAKIDFESGNIFFDGNERND